MKRFKCLKIFFLSITATLLLSSNEGIMGLREKHPVYSKLFDFPFFYEGSLLTILNFRELRNIMGLALCTT
jgi:hypothetical protein